MDLASFGETADRVLALTLPDGSPATDDDGTPIEIAFWGADAPQFEAARNILINETRKLIAKNPIVPVQEEQRLGVAFLAGITKAWNRMPAFGEKSLEFNAKNAERVYGRIPWIRRKADEFLNPKDKAKAPGPVAADFTGADTASPS